MMAAEARREQRGNDAELHRERQQHRRRISASPGGEAGGAREPARDHHGAEGVEHVPPARGRGGAPEAEAADPGEQAREIAGMARGRVRQGRSAQEAEAGGDPREPGRKRHERGEAYRHAEANPLAIAHRALALAASLLLFAACSAVDALHAVTPDEGTRRIPGLRYAEGPRGTLDLYLPPGGGAGAPVLVFFHGGGWRTGAKEDYRFLGSAFAARGWVVAIPDYRLVPEVRWPAFAEDGAAAVAALPGLLARQGLPPPPALALAGHSAGAHTAAMLALDRRWLAARGMDPCRDIAALLGLAGPYAVFPTRARTVVAAFGEAPQPPEVAPIAHVSAAAPPAVLLTGSADALVAPRNSAELAAALARAGRPAELRVLEGVGHVEIVAAIAAPLRHVAPTLELAERGLRAALAAPPRACP